MNADALHTDASADGIDTLVVRFDGNFCALARFTGNAFDRNESIENFRHFGFHQFGEEARIGTRENDDRSRTYACAAHFFAQGADRITFAPALTLDLLRFRKQKLPAVMEN